MLAVCTGSEPRMDVVLENLLQELAENRDEKIRLIERCKLSAFLWQQMQRIYGYECQTPSIRDFAIHLFKDCYFRNFNDNSALTADSLIFLKRWKDSRQFERAFEILSDECAEVLGIEQDLAKRDFRELIELDYFCLIDQKIISDLVKAVSTRTVSSGDVSLWIRQRRQGHWYSEFIDVYEAIEYAAKFLEALNNASLSMESLAEGVQRYSYGWYKLDQFYRKFIYHVRKSGQASLMGPLSDQIENLYSNNYLLKLGDIFQRFVDEAPRWQAIPVHKQSEFFEHWVQPYIRSNKKVCVIISDAMRYEIGEELVRRIHFSNEQTGDLKYRQQLVAIIEPALSMLPSYTQLGMAALLPNKKLEIADNETGTVLVDDQSSQGIANRIKILGHSISKRATACKADELIVMKGDECRALVRDHDVIYIYHNRVDATGDKRESEDRVFEAVEDTIDELTRLIKKMAGANAANFLVTADHGFIYQNRAIDESDFSGVDAEGEQILFRDRRFVLGKGLAETSSLHKFTSSQLGLFGELEVQIPKSINRLRLKGSGSRFVHGGASLQEVVIPVLKINKKEQSDVAAVEVEILRGASSVITAGQLAVTMYQTGPVTEKIQKRILRTGIYTETGDLISDKHDLIFDLTSENPREREVQVRFVLTHKADEANGQEVILKLTENYAGTSHEREYKSLRYTIRRSFTSDFDF
jgi:uncharacterized protein (TIGR02687 family)